MKPRSTVLFSLILLLALPLWAESVPDRKDRHLEKAISGGLAPTDFHHLFLAFAWRNTEPDWKAVDANIRRLELVTADPLMVDELRLIRSRMAVAEGRPTAARDGFRAMGGLQRWWATDSIDLPELEDFDEQAMLPGPDTEWRAVPGTDTTGWVRLEGIEWPVHRRLVYLATTAHSDKEQPAALRLGAAEAARAWVNGVQVLSTDFPLDRAPDQAAGGAWLRQGANAIVVAVATETSDWWLRARLTAVDGSTLAGVTETDAVPSRFAAGEKAAPEVRTVESAIRTAIEGGDQDARLALAAYLVDRRPFPRSSGVAQEACRRARAVDPAAARLLEWLVTTEPKQRRQLLEEVRSLDDSLTPARIGLAQWYNERGLDQEAYGVLEGAEDPWSTAIRLDIDFERWGALVLHDMAALSREHPRAVETGVIVARRAVDARWWPLAREILARLEELTPGIAGVTEIRERLAQECGDVAELRVLLRSALDEDPNRPGLRVRVARAALAEGEAADALRVLQDGLTRCPRHPDLLLELAGVQHLRGDDESAMVLTRRLLEARPQDRQAQRLLELLGGEAEDRSWLRQPEQLWQLAEKIQDSTTPAVAVVEHTEIRFLPGNSTEERVQRAILINVAEQANEQLVHRVAYVPEVQRLRVLSARILRRDGSEVNARRAETPRLSDPALNMFYDTRLRIFQFRELEDGDLIEMSYVLSETAEANDTGPYKGGLIRLAGDLPIHLLEVSLEGRQEYLPDWEVVHLNGMPEMSERDDGSRHIGWTWGNVAALPREVPRPPELLVAPYLVYSNHPEWPDLADWYGRHIQPRIRISSQIEELANKLVKGIQNRRERISRIYRYVANDIQYVGLELGEHRFRPFSASWVLSHQIGDCKDKAALMVALFKVVGIPAQMVLVRTADLGEVPSELAVLEVFNHVIAYLPEDDLWLDGTASGQDPFFPPGLDQVAWSLVIGQKGARPGPTPVIGAGLSKVFCRLERDDTSSEVLVEMRTEDTGDAASSRRAQLFGSRNPQKFATWLQGIFPGAEVLGEAELSMPPSQDPARFSIRGKMPLSVLTGSGGVQAYPGRINLVSNLAPVGERTTPVLMTVRPVLNWTVEVMLGESGETLPDDIALDTRFGSFELRYEEVTKGYTVEGSLVLKSGLVEPDAVPDLRRFLLEVEEALGRPVEVR